jgi:hypothetical protein
MRPRQFLHHALLSYSCRKFFGAFGLASFLARRRLSVCVIRIWLVGFVMSNCASRRCAELAVSRHVSGNAAHDGTFEASFRLRWRDRCDSQEAGRHKNPFHDRSPHSHIEIKSSRRGLFRQTLCKFDNLIEVRPAAPSSWKWWCPKVHLHSSRPPSVGVTAALIPIDGG